MIDDSQDELEAPWGGMFPHPVLGLSTIPRRATKAELIEMAKTAQGGWTREQLAAWGVPWPPPKGWKQSLINNE
jgi:hypothetical protein